MLAAFDADMEHCAAQSSLAPDGCPFSQQDSHFYDTFNSATWKIDGRPSESATLAVADGFITVTADLSLEVSWVDIDYGGNPVVQHSSGTVLVTGRATIDGSQIDITY